MFPAAVQEATLLASHSCTPSSLSSIKRKNPRSERFSKQLYLLQSYSSLLFGVFLFAQGFN